MIKENMFFSRLQDECTKLNKSVNQIERELGYPRNALHNYKNNRLPSGERLVELADYFGVSPKYLLGEKILDSKKMCGKEVGEIFKDLSSEDKKKIYILGQEWLLSQI